MAEQVTTMVLKVDLQCGKCFKKVKKVLCKIPEIRDQVYDEKKNTVTIKVVCSCPEEIKRKIYCKGGKSIECIEIIKPPPLKPKPTQPQPPPPPPPPQPQIEKDPPPTPTPPPNEKEKPPTPPPPPCKHICHCRPPCYDCYWGRPCKQLGYCRPPCFDYSYCEVEKSSACTIM